MAASNGFLPTGCGSVVYDEADDKPILLMKKNGSSNGGGGDGHGITALINRQLQGMQILSLCIYNLNYILYNLTFMFFALINVFFHNC